MAIKRTLLGASAEKKRGAPLVSTETVRSPASRAPSRLDVARVILFVDDLDVMLAFYRDVLGLVPIGQPSRDFVTLDAGRCQIALHTLPKAKAPKAKGAGAARKALRAAASLKIAFYTADVEVLRADLMTRGARMKKTITFGGLQLCDGVDPEGNVFQISSRLA